MHMNEYVLETLTRERLAAMRAEGERSARLYEAGRRSWSLRVALGTLFGGIARRLHAVRRDSSPKLGRAVNREGTSARGVVRG